MLLKLNDEPLKLRRLSDEEFEAAERFAKEIGEPLTRCPTCGTKQTDDPEAEEVEPTYRFRGETYPCDCRVQIALFTRYLIARIPVEYMRLNWGDYEASPEAKDFVEVYLDNHNSFKKHGYGVEFGGPRMGIGKTWAATHIGKTLVKRGIQVYFSPFVEMVATFEQSNSEELENRFRTTPYVILDDIMPPRSEKQENFYHTKFEAIIRHRTNYNLPTIITTNLIEEDLHRYYPRPYSLLSAKQTRIEMTGEDARSGMVRLENIELITNREVRPIT